MKRLLALLLALSLLLLLGCHEEVPEQPISSASALGSETAKATVQLTEVPSTAASASVPVTEADPETVPNTTEEAALPPTTEPPSEENPEPVSEDLFGDRGYYTATWSCFHSVVIQTWDEMGKGYNEYTVYCFDLRTGEKLNTLQLLTRLGIENKFEFVEKTREKVSEAFDRMLSSESSAEYAHSVNENKAWTVQNVGFTPTFVTEDGRLGVIVEFGGPNVAGRGYSYAVMVLDLDLTEPVPEYKQEEVLEDTPTIDAEIESVIALGENDPEGFHVYVPSYFTTQYRDISSLVVHEEPRWSNTENDVYRVYLYNSADQKLYDTIQLLDYLGVPYDSFLEGAREAVLDYFDEHYSGYDSAAWDALYLNAARDWSASWVNLDMPAYTTDDGSLYIIAKIGKPEGRGYFYVQLKPDVSVG